MQKALPPNLALFDQQNFATLYGTDVAQLWQTSFCFGAWASSALAKACTAGLTGGGGAWRAIAEGAATAGTLESPNFAFQSKSIGLCSLTIDLATDSSVSAPMSFAKIRGVRFVHGLVDDHPERTVGQF